MIRLTGNIIINQYLNDIDKHKNNISVLNAIIENAALNDDISNNEYEQIYNYCMHVIKEG